MADKSLVRNVEEWNACIEDNWFGGSIMGVNCPVAVWTDPPALAFVPRATMPDEDTPWRRSQKHGYLCYYGGILTPEQVRQLPSLDRIFRKADEVLTQVVTTARNPPEGELTGTRPPMEDEGAEGLNQPPPGWKDRARDNFDASQWMAGFDIDTDVFKLLHFGDPGLQMRAVVSPLGKCPAVDGVRIRRDDCVFYDIQLLFSVEPQPVSPEVFDQAWYAIEFMAASVSTDERLAGTPAERASAVKTAALARAKMKGQGEIADLLSRSSNFALVLDRSPKGIVAMEALLSDQTEPELREMLTPKLAFWNEHPELPIFVFWFRHGYTGGKTLFLKEEEHLFTGALPEVVIASLEAGGICSVLPAVAPSLQARVQARVAELQPAEGAPGRAGPVDLEKVAFQGPSYADLERIVQNGYEMAQDTPAPELYFLKMLRDLTATELPDGALYVKVRYPIGGTYEVARIVAGDWRVRLGEEKEDDAASVLDELKRRHAFN